MATRISDPETSHRRQLGARARRLEEAIEALSRSGAPRRDRGLAIAEFHAQLRAVRAAMRRTR